LEEEVRSEHEGGFRHDLGEGVDAGLFGLCVFCVQGDGVDFIEEVFPDILAFVEGVGEVEGFDVVGDVPEQADGPVLFVGVFAEEEEGVDDGLDVLVGFDAVYGLLHQHLLKFVERDLQGGAVGLEHEFDDMEGLHDGGLVREAEQQLFKMGDDQFAGLQVV
jgi:hypothetical protein